MSDGIKDREKEDTMNALDIAEIVWNSMGLEEAVPVEAPEGATEVKEEEAPA